MMYRNKRRLRRALTTSSLQLFAAVIINGVLTFTAQSATNDVYPGDYYPGDPGANTFAFYAYDRKSIGPYANGHLLINGRLDGQIAAGRATHTFSLLGLTATTVAVATWANLETSPSSLSNAIGNRTVGLGDMRLGLTVWPIKNRKNANYLGVSAMVIAPTGDYDDGQVLNYAENRWKLVVSGGWQKDLTPRLLVELSPELTIYGDNNDYSGGDRLEQQASYALTGYVRWRQTRVFHMYLGAQRNRGGETGINGVMQNNPSENTRVSVGASFFLPSSQQIILRLSKETEISNGFRLEQEVALRYQKSF